MTRRIAIVLESALDNTWYDMERLLMQAGIDPSQHRVFPLVPRVADLTKLKWASDEVQQGIQRLGRELAEWQPHFCLLLDRSGYLLRAFHGDKRSVDDWRGSVLLATHLVPGTKVMTTYSPKRLTVEYGLTGVIRFDLKRALEESKTDELVVPQDDIAVDLTFEQLMDRLSTIHARGLLATDGRVAIDIEGWVDFVSCIGFATGHNRAFVVPFIRADGTSWWNEEEEVQLWEAVAAVLEDPAVPKVLQNSLYDCFVLAWSYGIVIRGITDDTMLKHFELLCEMEKNLGFQTSIYTKHPYYKYQRKSDDERVQLEYCGRDCCRTLECCDVQESRLAPRQHEHYRFNMSLLAPLLYMELRGIRYDSAEAKRRLEATQEQIYELQDQINQEAAKSEARPALRAFYQALAEPGGSPAAGDAGSTNGRDVCKALILLLTEAFCCCERDRAEWREVEEVTWQPKAWNGKKWVRKGPRVQEVPGMAGGYGEGDSPGEDFNPDQLYYQAHRKLVQKRCPVAVETLADVRRFVLDSRADDCKRALAILRSVERSEQALSPAQRGELATLLGVSLKISASGRDKDEEQDDGTTERGDERDANWYLYEHCKLPKQWIKDGIRNTDRLASDAKAVVLAWMASGKTEETRDPRALVFAKLKRLLTETKALRVAVDQDGRIRASLNLVGTDTHRISCSKSPTGTSRLNLQTVTKKHRSMYLADEGCEMGQLDLAGADGWTTASYAKMLGDPTMLEDLKAKLKPAQIVVLMLDQGEVINSIPRDQLKVMCKDITEEKEWRYFPMKKVVHGSSYQSGKRKVSEGIALDSFKATGRPVYFSPDQCERVQQRCFFVRYPGIKRYQEWVAREILEKGQLVASNGFARKFFGRKTDSGTVRKGLAHLPQVYTTYATELAMHRLWNDPENRAEDGSLHIELLLTVHDSLLTQWPKERTEWAKAKQHDYFNNPIQIAHETVVIPASGSYGPSWGEQVNAL